MTVSILPEQHAIATHFPIAMLLTGIVFDILASIARKPVWRAVGFWMMLVGALMTIPSVVTGWMTFSVLYSNLIPPVVAVQHRLLAIVTTVLALTLVILRIADRDKATSWTRVLHMLAGIVAALAAGATGYLGGQLVFKGGANEVSPSAPHAAAQAEFTPPPALVTEGENLFWSDAIGCRDCHRIAERGGLTGPNLTTIGASKPDVMWHVRHLEDPAAVVPGSMMPKNEKLAPLQREALAMYLVSRR